MPIVIVVVAFGVSTFASARYLPRLAPDRVGTVAFAVVCCLVGVGLALATIEIYVTVRTIDNASTIGGLGDRKADLLAAGLIEMLRGVGPIVGLAAAVYLLAPAAEDPQPS